MQMIIDAGEQTMRIICIDRALGNQAWVQLHARNLNIVLKVKLIHQPYGVEARVHKDGDEDNYISLKNAGIHRAVLHYISHFLPHYKREAYGARMEWEC